MKRWLAALMLMMQAPAPAQDWADLAFYRDRNQALRAGGPQPEIVFIGDSITLGWQDRQPEFFTPLRLNRGIGGQTTPQLLLRFRQDVIDLHPKLVHIMGGTNDIAGNTGPMTAAQTEGNLASMAELAQAAGIGVILASIPPPALFPWRPELSPEPQIEAINAWLRHYAAAHHCQYADYWTVLKDDRGGLPAAFSSDGVHPNATGYLIMRPVVEAIVEKDSKRAGAAKRRKKL